MIKTKKQIREDFRNGVFIRDNFTCQICGHVYKPGTEDYEVYITDVFDAHHITDRHNMPYGGYVLENGITVCKDTCHKMVELHAEHDCAEGYCPDALYEIIGSSWQEAVEASIDLLGHGMVPGEYLDWHPLTKYGKVVYTEDHSSEGHPMIILYPKDNDALDAFLKSI